MSDREILTNIAQARARAQARRALIQWEEAKQAEKNRQENRRKSSGTQAA